jgi:hypothetical protein
MYVCMYVCVYIHIKSSLVISSFGVCKLGKHLEFETVRSTLYVCVCVCMCVCMCVYIYIYTHMMHVLRA